MNKDKFAFDSEYLLDKVDDAQDSIGYLDKPNITWLPGESGEVNKIAYPRWNQGDIPNMSQTLAGFLSGIAIVLGQPNSGKAQPLDAKILTPKGWVLMGDLNVGDLVFAVDGTQVPITGIFPQGKKSVYKLTLTDRTSTRATEDHLWFTRTKMDREMGREGSVKTTRDIIETLKVKTGNLRNNHTLPLTNAVQMDAVPVELDPYFVGVLIGNGGLTGASTILTSADKEIVTACSKAIEKQNYKLVPTGKTGHRVSEDKRYGPHRQAPLHAELSRLGLLGKYSYEKRIPEIYLWNSIEVRTALLQGLLDTDGEGTLTGCVVYSTSSPGLAQDIAHLVRSLGGVASIGAANKSGYKKDGKYIPCKPSTRISIALPDQIVPFRLKRKLARISPRRDNTRKLKSLQRSISSVECVGKEQTQCITISHPEQLYLTDDFIPTHNTTALLSMAVGALKLNNDVVLVDLSLDDPFKKRYVQYMCNLSGLRYSDVLAFRTLPPTQRELFDEADAQIRTWIRDERFIPLEGKEKNYSSRAVAQMTTAPNVRTINVRNWRYLVSLMKRVRTDNPGKKIVLLLDSWNDIDLSGTQAQSDLGQMNSMLETLGEESHQNEIMILSTSHARKTLNRAALSLEDVKGTKDMEYKAVFGAIIRNEYRENVLADPMTYEDPRDGCEYPIMTFLPAKSKVSSWLHPLFYILRADICRIDPLQPFEYELYAEQFYNRSKKGAKDDD